MRTTPTTNSSSTVIPEVDCLNQTVNKYLFTLIIFPPTHHCLPKFLFFSNAKRRLEVDFPNSTGKQTGNYARTISLYARVLYFSDKTNKAGILNAKDKLAINHVCDLGFGILVLSRISRLGFRIFNRQEVASPSTNMLNSRHQRRRRRVREPQAPSESGTV